MENEHHLDENALKKIVRNLDDYLWSITNNVTCSICRELSAKPVTTSCGHSFCSSCLKRSLNGGGRSGCPLCRRPLKRREASENHVLTEIARMCQEFPRAFREDVLNLNPELKDVAEELMRSSRIAEVHSEKDEGAIEREKKEHRDFAETPASQESLHVDASRLIRRYGRKRDGNDSALELKSASQAETGTQGFIPESPDLERKLRRVRKVRAKEKVDEWLEGIGKCEPDVSTSMIRIDYKKSRGEERKEGESSGKGNPDAIPSDPYEFVPSQRTGTAKRARKRSKGRKTRLPDFEAIQHFSKRKKKEEIESMSVRRIASEDGDDRMLAPPRCKTPEIRDVTPEKEIPGKAKGKSESSRSPGWSRVSTLKMDFESARKENRPRRKSLNISGGEGRTREGAEPRREDDVKDDDDDDDDDCSNGSMYIEDLSQSSELLIGFSTQSSSDEERDFRRVVRDMEMELAEMERSASVVVADKTEASAAEGTRRTIPFALLGKINKRRRKCSIAFLRLGRLSPHLKTSGSAVVKLVFPKSPAPRNDSPRPTAIEAGVQATVDGAAAAVQTENDVERVAIGVQTAEAAERVARGVQTAEAAATERIARGVQTAAATERIARGVQTAEATERVARGVQTAEEADRVTASVQTIIIGEDRGISMDSRLGVCDGGKKESESQLDSELLKELDKTWTERSQALMERAVENLNSDLRRIGKAAAGAAGAAAVASPPAKHGEESDSDIFIEQTPPRSATQESCLIVSQDVTPKRRRSASKENDPNRLNRKPAKMCIMSSRVKNPKNVDRFASRFNVEHVANPRKDLTHLIVGLYENEDDEALPNCTPKLLYAMANKKWIVSEAWIEACLKADVILPEGPYESVDPKGGNGCAAARLSDDYLLDKCEVYLLGDYDRITKEEFSGLIRDCGGVVVARPEDLSRSPNKIRMILVDSSEPDPRFSVLMKKYRTAVMFRDVIIVSILGYKMVNFTQFLAGDANVEDLLKWGYPFELVRADNDDEEDEDEEEEEDEDGSGSRGKTH